LSIMVASVIATVKVKTSDCAFGKVVASFVFVVLPAFGGMALHLTAYKFASAQRSAALGLLGANVGLAYQFFVVQPDQWWLNFQSAFWPGFICLVVGALGGEEALSGTAPSPSQPSEKTDGSQRSKKVT